MAVHASIVSRIKSVLRMSKPSINIRFSGALMNDMEALIESGSYASKTELINRAVSELIQREGMRPIIREEIRRYLQEKEGSEP